MLKKYLITGGLVWLPLAITLWLLHWVLGLMDGMFALLLTVSQALLPSGANAFLEQLRHIPGLSVLVMVVATAFSV